MGLILIEWLGAVGALAGTLVVALNLPWSGWGFVVMLVFSGVLLGAAVAARRWPYAALFVGYEAVNVLGIYRWLLAA